jgi:hypothetical protein
VLGYAVPTPGLPVRPDWLARCEFHLPAESQLATALLAKGVAAHAGRDATGRTSRRDRSRPSIVLDMKTLYRIVSRGLLIRFMKARDYFRSVEGGPKRLAWYRL